MTNAQSSSKIDKPSVGVNVGGDTEEKPATFHDFLGNKGSGQESAPASAVGGGRQQPEVSPSATSDLGFERLAGNHLEGTAFYGLRGDITGQESSSHFAGNNRSNSDSFIISSREKFPPGQVDSQDGPLFTKLLRYSGAEQPRRPPDEEVSFGMQQMRPISASFIPQSSTGGRTDSNPSKWDRSMALTPGRMVQYPPCTGQVIPLGYQAAPNRFKDTNVGPSNLVSQAAADEGSRTGIKGSGILTSINAGGAVTGRQPAGVLIRSGKQKSGVGVSEPEYSATLSHRGMDSNGCQMTIFYGGQAHVFDNVDRNKAELIMALAGSSGGSWSTTYKPNSAAGQPSAGDNHRTGDNVEAGISLLRQLHRKPSHKGDSH